MSVKIYDPAFFDNDVASTLDVDADVRRTEALREAGALPRAIVNSENATSVEEKANRAKSDFLSNMSHELRGPLNAILGFAQLMESDAQPPTPSQKESIAQILDAGWHLLNLINGISNLAVIESGKVSLSGEPVSLDEVMVECPPQALHGARLHTLLCVEDNPANLKLVEQLIKRRPDMRLMTAVNGTLGIALARASQPEVILMDIKLPDISGLEALRILRDDPATAHIPVVALSANAMPRDIELGMTTGFFRYLTKPIKVHEFMDALHAALEFAENALGLIRKDEVAGL
jgi:CheY-like chemotaxis protein